MHQLEKNTYYLYKGGTTRLPQNQETGSSNVNMLG